MHHLLCVGLGYSARASIQRLPRAQWHISATTRTGTAGAVSPADQDTIPFEGKERSEALAQRIAEATHLLMSAPPQADGDPLLRWHAADVAAARSLKTVCYLSTIGVYGDRGGDFVDEAMSPRPGNDRSRWRLAAEQQWQALSDAGGKRLVILRLGGIYGPGRSTLDAVAARQAKRIVKPGQVFNRIHVDDIAQAVAAALEKEGVSGIFNVVDDEAAPPQDVVAYAARLMGREPPPEVAFEDADLSPMARSFYGESKRVRNDKLKSGLGVRLLYPTYREGLAAIAGCTKT